MTQAPDHLPARLRDLIAECCHVELDARRAVREVEQHGPCPC
ncbi:hypothetical protein [Acrocarpospora sp. B8E8]